MPPSKVGLATFLGLTSRQEIQLFYKSHCLLRCSGLDAGPFPQSLNICCAPQLRASRAGSSSSSRSHIEPPERTKPSASRVFLRVPSWPWWLMLSQIQPRPAHPFPVQFNPLVKESDRRLIPLRRPKPEW